jgi:aldose 1-epimerase
VEPGQQQELITNGDVFCCMRKFGVESEPHTRAALASLLGRFAHVAQGRFDMTDGANCKRVHPTKRTGGHGWSNVRLVQGRHTPARVPLAAMSTSLATGKQYELRFGDQYACATELGAALRAYRDGAGPLVDEFGHDEPISGGRGQTLIPWPNRIRDGKYELNGAKQQLPITEVAKNNASHGLVRWVNWQIDEASRTDASVSFWYRLHPQPGYPFTLHLTVAYELGESGLSVSMSAHNMSATACPFGMGAHPFFTTGETTVDTNRLRCPASTYITTDDQLVTNGTEAVSQADDYRDARTIGDAVINGCYTDLARDENGNANIDLLPPNNGDGDDYGPGVRVWMDSTFNYVQLFTGDSLPNESRRRQGIAIEPMTCASDAFNNGMGLIHLQPDESISGTWGVTRI